MDHPFIKFYARDWQSCSELQSCSYSARGLWIELMCLMASAPRYGYLEIMEGKPLTEIQISKLTRGDKLEVNQLLNELKENGVCSIEDQTGVIYCRRMIKDFERYQQRVENGRKGGNPNIISLDSKQKSVPETNNQKPETRSHGYNHTRVNATDNDQVNQEVNYGVNHRERKPRPGLKIPQEHETHDGFDEFYGNYPKKGDRNECLIFWTANGLHQVKEQIIQNIQDHYEHVEGWARYCKPDSLQYLKNRTWEYPVIPSNKKFARRKPGLDPELIKMAREQGIPDDLIK